MATTNEQIILSLDAKDAIEQMAKLKAQADKLKQSQRELDLTTKQGREEYQLMATEIKALNKQHHEQERYLMSELKTTQSASTSLNGMGKRLADLKVQYRELNAELRESSVGKSMLADMQKLDEALKKGEQSYGQFGRNVGNYPSAFKGVFDKINGVLANFGSSMEEVVNGGVKGLATLGKSVIKFGVTLLKSPIGLVALAVMGLVSAFKKLREAIAKNDDAGTAFDKLKASFQPFAKMMNESLRKVVEWLGRCAEWLTAKIPTALGKAIKAVGVGVATATKGITFFERAYLSTVKVIVGAYKTAKDALGFNTDGLNKTLDNLDTRIEISKKRAEGVMDMFTKFANKIATESKQAVEETKRVDDAEERQRQRTIANAKLEREIATLRNKEAEVDKKNYEDRVKLRKEINAKEEQIARNEKATAMDRLKTLQYEQKVSAETSDDLKNQIADAQAMVIQADTNLQQAMIRNNKSIQALTASIVAEQEKESKEIVANFNKVLEKISKVSNKSIEELTKTLQGKKVGKQLAEDMKALDDYFSKFSAEQLGVSAEEFANMWADAKKALTTYNEQQKVTAEITKEQTRIKEQSSAKELVLTQAKNVALEKLYRLQSKGIDISNELTEVEIANTRKQLNAQRQAIQEQLEYLEEQYYNTDNLSIANIIDEQMTALSAKLAEVNVQIAKSEADEFDKRLQQEKEFQQKRIETAEKALEITQKFNSAINAIGDAQVERYEQGQQQQRDALQQRLDNGLISQEQYNDSVANLDAELNRKKVETQRKQAMREKAIAIFEIGIDIAKQITKHLGNPLMIATISALGAMQLASVIATPLPKLAKGGLIKGKSHAEGGVMLEAEGGEAIINKRSTAMYKELLSQINQAGGGVAFGKTTSGRFARGGVVNNGGYGLPDTTANTQQPIFVAVTDINRGQERFAKVVKSRKL